MNNLIFAAAATLIVVVSNAITYLAGREHGYMAGRGDGYGEGWKQCAVDTDMDAANPDTGYAELHGDGEANS